MNRRHFLMSTAAIGAVGGPLAPVRGDDDVAPGFHLGAVTYNVLKDFDLDTVIRMLEAAGFDGVELRTGHKHGVEPSLGQEERARVRQRFRQSRIQLVSFGTTCEFQSPDPAERRRQVGIARRFIDLARDTGARGIKVRPNGFPPGVPHEVTYRNIAGSLREVGDYGARQGIHIYMEVHGKGTSMPDAAAAIMRATDHPHVGLCWNSNDTDVAGGSVRQSFDLLKPWIRHVHINELANDYPWRELFGLLRSIRYSGYTLCEAQASPEPERFLRWYRKLWIELNRSCVSA